VTPDLTSAYLGLKLRSPLVASASPLSGTLKGIKTLEEAGAGAVVLPSLFEEQLIHESLELDRLMAMGGESYAEALSLFPEMHDYNTGPDEYLKMIEDAKVMVDIPVIPSLNGTSVGGWIRYAHLMQEAGADAIELNIYLIAADTETPGEEIETRYLELVSRVRDTLDIPVAIKIGPFFTALSNMAWRLVEAGADGLVLFNRFYQPDIDIETLEVVPRLVLSNSHETRLPLRWIAILRDQVPISLAATTGFHTVEDVVKVLLAGADIVMMASALLEDGPNHITRLEKELMEWLEDHEYASIDQMRGSMSRGAIKDPAAFERANYMRVLTSYSQDH
jgi:dihydroorotate dehydrogenase (fumarate)